MFDRLFFPILSALALAMIALALVWPQGLGDRSPPPFGHTPVQQTTAMQAAMKREADAANRRTTQAKAAVSEAQARAIAPTQ